MSQPTMKSWKTTLAGTFAAIFAYLAKDASMSPALHQIFEVLGMVSIAAVGFFAQDNASAPVVK